MKKQSLIQVHALLVCVRRELDRSGEVHDGQFDDYDQFGVTPTSIHRRKDDHSEAIQLLLDGIHETADGQREPPVH